MQSLRQEKSSSGILTNVIYENCLVIWGDCLFLTQNFCEGRPQRTLAPGSKKPSCATACNILDEFHIPKNIVRLIKMYLYGTYNTVQVDKLFSYSFPIKNVLRDILDYYLFSACFRMSLRCFMQTSWNWSGDSIHTKKWKHRMCISRE